MYVPKLFQELDRELVLAFVRAHNFAAVVTVDGGRPVATHTPVEVVETETGLTVYGHLSRANSQWKTWDGQEALVIFHGPHTYVSPRWYAQMNVPTWNYQIVQAAGPVRTVPTEALAGLLTRLVHRHEAESTYRLETLPPEFVEREMKGTVGFAVEVTRLEAGYKLSQNRTDADHANIIVQLEQQPDADGPAVAAAMRDQRRRARSAR